MKDGEYNVRVVVTDGRANIEFASKLYKVKNGFQWKAIKDGAIKKLKTILQTS